MGSHTCGETTSLHHEVLVMRGPHGGHLFASLQWPRQTRCLSEALILQYVVSHKEGAYSRYKRIRSLTMRQRLTLLLICSIRSRRECRAWLVRCCSTVSSWP